ncbi:peptidoglycan-binding protein [bacterium]|nr:peptidoglycan-binding protein [bacterium]
MLLSDGSRGSKVKGLQYMLNKHGEELKKDGIFGPKTLESVRKLQHEHGLKVDGIVGPETLKILNSPGRKAFSHPKPEARPEAKPEAKPETQSKPPEFGLSPKTLASLRKSGKLELLRQLPPEVAGRYEKMSPKARETMFTQLSGSTWGNSHRDAFVNGKVMGMDTFSYMDDQVKAKVGRGQMSVKEADGLRADLQQLKKLSPKQRDAIAEMILLQQGK